MRIPDGVRLWSLATGRVFSDRPAGAVLYLSPWSPDVNHTQPVPTVPATRRLMTGAMLVCLAMSLLPVLVLARGEHGRADSASEVVWGGPGMAEGRFCVPRAMTIDAEDRLYIVDKAARIQVFTADGQFLRGWRTPAWENGKPTGLSIDRGGNLLVADTHYYRVLVYAPTGQLLGERTLGGTPGNQPGQFGWVTDVVQDPQGCYYVAEYGEYDRIQKLDARGRFLCQWGGHGSQPGQFLRPQSLALDGEGQLWVADACNHRIQVFDVRGDVPRLVRLWGGEGSRPGQLRYPYDLVLDPQDHVYVCEFGNHRVQKFTLQGASLGTWGIRGRANGQLNNPWALVRDSCGRIHVLDTYNQRVQRVRL